VRSNERRTPRTNQQRQHKVQAKGRWWRCIARARQQHAPFVLLREERLKERGKGTAAWRKW